MLTLTQTRLKTFFATFVAIASLSILGGIILPQGSAYAAEYPGKWCTFLESTDNKTLTGSCTDERDNGGFHGIAFKESGKNTFTFTDSYWTLNGPRIPITSHDKPDGNSATGQAPTETKCKPATINYSGDTATISGQYASTTASEGGLRMWACVDLLAGKVTVDKGLLRLTAWRDTLLKNLLENIPKTECKKFNEGSTNYKQCVSGAAISVNLCVGSNGSVWKETMSYADANEQKEAYKATTVDCLDEKLSVTTRAEIKSAVNNAQSAADDKEGEIVDTEGEGGEETLGETTSCAIDGIGWIVCPVMSFIGRMNDAAFGFLETMLGIRPAVVTSEPVRNAWAAFRDISNVAFVIAFMVIVYSQLTSAGISNYGIKKMLPRIVAAAILVNISFYICAVAVDISNIIGSSVYSLLKDSIDVGSEIKTTQWESSISGILGIAATGIGVVLLLVAITMAPAVLLAFVLIILILIARQALVILLIVIAPLAFVAYLLPNTESWFKKWQKAFVTVLMVYPIVGIIFGASTLAASVLTQVAQGGEEDQQLLQLVALGVLAVPLFAVPAVLKGALSAAGSIGTKIAGLADKSTRMSGRQLGDRSKQMAGGLRDAAQRRALAGEGILGKKGWRSGYGLGVGGIMRGTSNRNNKYNSLGERAKSAEDTYLNSDPKQALRRRQATKGQETAELTTQLNKDQAKREHLVENHGLHDRAHQSGYQLQDEQAIHKAQSTENYLANNGALRTRAVQAGIGASNTEEINKNDATTAYMAANSGVGSQYEQLNESQGELEIQKDATKNAFDSNAVGMAVADRKATAGIQSNITSKRAETRAVQQNTGLNVQAQAASDTLEAAKAEETAVVQELRTAKGGADYVAAQGPAAQAVVNEIQRADEQKRVQTQRATNASGVTTGEFASQVAASEGVVGGLAEVAGSVDPFGARRAISTAQQVEIEQFNKNTASEQATMSKTHYKDKGRVTPQHPLGEPSLREIATDPTQSFERRAAAAGMFMKTAPMEELHSFIDEIGSIPDTYPGGVPGEGAEARQNMFMQIKSDMNRVPFAIGDRARAAIGRGDYTTADHGTHEQQLATRVRNKISGDDWRGMDPDDRMAIRKLASTPAGKAMLGPEGMNNLMESFKDINATPTVRAQTKVDARQEANRVARSFGMADPFPDTDTP